MGISGLSSIRPLDVNLHDRHLTHTFQRRQQSVHIAYQTRASYMWPSGQFMQKKVENIPEWEQTSVYEIIVDGGRHVSARQVFQKTVLLVVYCEGGHSSSGDNVLNKAVDSNFKLIPLLIGFLTLYCLLANLLSSLCLSFFIYKLRGVIFIYVVGYNDTYFH